MDRQPLLVPETGEAMMLQLRVSDGAKWLRGWLLCLALSGPVWGEMATGADQLVIEGLAAESRLEPRVALTAFQAAARERPGDAMIEQKIAQQLSDIAFLEENPAERIRLAGAAFPHAQLAVELDPTSAVARLSLAVLHGKLAVEGDVSAKIERVRLVKKYTDEALALAPDYAWAWHVLGRWHAEMVEIGVARRAVVALFFGGLPTASLTESIRCLEKAVSLEPEAVAHHVELGFSYRRAGRPEQALASWERALALPSMKIYDANAKQRVMMALAAIAKKP